MTQRIGFESAHYSPDPAPIKGSVPKWYKDAPRFFGNKKQFIPVATKTFKECSPFLDAFTSGYSMPCPVDIVVQQENGEPLFSWGLKDETFISIRNKEIMSGVPVPKGYANCFPAFHIKVDFRIPKGRSILVTHPLNRFDLPFLTLSGVVDSGVMHRGGLPFFIQEGFEGIIQQGTPLAQIIPFKRETWEMKEEKGLTKEAQIDMDKSNAVFSGWYKNTLWQKKNYN